MRRFAVINAGLENGKLNYLYGDTIFSNLNEAIGFGLQLLDQVKDGDNDTPFYMQDADDTGDTGLKLVSGDSVIYVLFIEDKEYEERTKIEDRF